jgi:hypothetical protein
VEDAEADQLEEIRRDNYERSLELIKDRVQKLSWQEMQELVAGVLRALGHRLPGLNANEGDFSPLWDEWGSWGHVTAPFPQLRLAAHQPRTPQHERPPKSGGVRFPWAAGGG